jgi:hypothetical protein
MHKLNAFVAKADGKQVRVYSVNSSLDSELISLGFKHDQELSMYVKDTANLSTKAALFARLRDLDVCFSDGKEWCPSELFEYFREQNLLHGKFKRVSWTAPNSYRIIEV